MTFGIHAWRFAWERDHLKANGPRGAHCDMPVKLTCAQSISLRMFSLLRPATRSVRIHFMAGVLVPLGSCGRISKNSVGSLSLSHSESFGVVTIFASAGGSVH